MNCSFFPLFRAERFAAIGGDHAHPACCVESTADCAFALEVNRNQCVFSALTLGFGFRSPNIMISGIPDIMAKKDGAHVLFFHGYRNLHEKKMEEMIIFVLAETLNVERLIVVDPFDACTRPRKREREREMFLFARGVFLRA